MVFPPITNDEGILQETWFIAQTAAESVKKLSSQRTDATLRTAEFVSNSQFAAYTTATVFSNLFINVTKKQANPPDKVYTTTNAARKIGIALNRLRAKPTQKVR
jgi:hypothetical protein